MPKRIRSVCGKAYGYIDEDGDYVLLINSAWYYVFPSTMRMSCTPLNSDTAKSKYSRLPEEYAVVDISSVVKNGQILDQIWNDQ